MDMSDAPELKRYIKPSVVIERGGRKIGIIGYVTTDTPVIFPNIQYHHTCITYSNLISDILQFQMMLEF